MIYLVVFLSLALLVVGYLLVSARLHARGLEDRLEGRSQRAAQAVAEAAALREANEALAERNAELERRHVGYDTLILKLEAQRDKWRDRYTALGPTFGNAQNMLWVTIGKLWARISNLSAALKRQAPTDLAQEIESLRKKSDALVADIKANVAEPVAAHVPSPPVGEVASAPCEGCG